MACIALGESAFFEDVFSAPPANEALTPFDPYQKGPDEAALCSTPSSASRAIVGGSGTGQNNRRRLILEIHAGQGACPVASRTMKQASVSSTDHGGGKRRGSGLSIIALSFWRTAQAQAAGVLGATQT